MIHLMIIYKCGMYRKIYVSEYKLDINVFVGSVTLASATEPFRANFWLRLEFLPSETDGNRSCSFFYEFRI